MNIRDVAIATITLARDANERSVLHAALRELSTLDVPVYVTDGGSGDEFVEALRTMPHFEVRKPDSRGLWPQVKCSLEAARESGARFVLYTEPDKRDFLRERVRPFIDHAPHDERLGVVLASRSRENIATFPPFQQYSESVINRCCAEVIGGEFDYSYGPFLLKSTLVERLAPPRDGIGWGWRTYAFGIAHRLRLRVEQCLYGCACPREQRGDSERIYRMLQLAQSVEGLALSTEAALDG